MIRKLLAFTCFLIVSSQVGAYKNGRVEQLSTLLQPEQVKEDINQWIQWLNNTHPDLTYTVSDVNGLFKDIEVLKNSIKKPITVKQFWHKISLLNNQLSDGHTLVTIDNWIGLTKELLNSNNALFPFEVVFKDAELVIAAKLGGKVSILSGYSISHINDKPIEEILDNMSKRVHGDSKIHRHAILERRFAIFYWLNYGYSENFTLDIQKSENVDRVVVEASYNLPYTIKSNMQFEDVYHYESVKENTGLLTLKSFNWADRDKYFSFMESSFEKMKFQKIEHLIIDI